MKKFKEWLSDYLRYILLIIGALLAFTLITFGVQTWLIVKKAGSPQTANTQTEETQAVSSKGGAIEILTEASAETESEKETLTETASETERQSETNSESETTVQDANAADSQTSGPTVQTDASETSAETAAPSDTAVTPETSAPVQTEPVVIQTEAQTETQAPTEPATEAPYQPVYLTMKGACYIRSYPDYGDNIIGEYPAGTAVEFLEDVGGWYKVQIDGMVGYMGARFF